jgi:hypothetical protein
MIALCGKPASMTDEGLVLLMAWGQLFVLLGVLTYFLLRGRA